MSFFQERIRNMTTAEEYDTMVGDTEGLDFETLHVDILHAEVLRAHVRYLFAQGRTRLPKSCLIEIISRRDISLMKCFVGHVDFEEFFVQEGGSLLLDFVRDGVMDVLTFLLDNGLPVNYFSLGRWTMLGEAFTFRKRDVVDLLLLRGADVNLPSRGKAPAFAAVKYCSVEYLDCLIMYGVDLSVTARAEYYILGIPEVRYDLGMAACTRGEDPIIKRLAEMRCTFSGKDYIRAYIIAKVNRGIRLSTCKETLEVLRDGGAEICDLASYGLPPFFFRCEEVTEILRVK